MSSDVYPEVSQCFPLIFTWGDLLDTLSQTVKQGRVNVCLPSLLFENLTVFVFILVSVHHMFVCQKGVTESIQKCGQVHAFTEKQYYKALPSKILELGVCSCINPLHLRVCVCSYASFQPHSLSELLFHTAEPDTDVSLRAHEPLTHKLRTDTVLLMPNTGVLREEHCCIMQSL